MAKKLSTVPPSQTPGPWIKWQLSPDSDPECRWIVTTADGELEVCGIIDNEDDADLIASAPRLAKENAKLRKEVKLLHQRPVFA